MLDFFRSETVVVAYTAAIFSAALAMIINIVFFRYTTSRTKKDENYELFYKLFIKQLGDLFHTLNHFREDQVRVNWEDLREEILKTIQSNQYRLTPRSFDKYRSYETMKNFENYRGGDVELDSEEIELFSFIVNDYINIYYEKAERQMNLFCLIDIWRFVAKTNLASYWSTAQVMKWYWGFDSNKLNHYLYQRLRECKDENDREKFNSIIDHINKDLDSESLALFKHMPDYLHYWEDSAAIGQYQLLEHWATVESLDVAGRQQLRTRLLEELYVIYFGERADYEKYFELEGNLRSKEMDLALNYLLEENSIKIDASSKSYEITSKGINKIEKIFYDVENL